MQDLHDQEIIELFRPLTKDLKPVTWIVVSVAFIVELVKERFKQQYNGGKGW